MYLEQRPGELAGLLEAAAAAGVDIHAVSVSEFQSRGLVRLVGSPADRLRRLCETLADAGIGPVVESVVISIAVEGRPGALRDVACLFADARINLLHAYLAPSSNGTPARCIVSVDDAARALEAIAARDRHGGPRPNGTMTPDEPRPIVGDDESGAAGGSIPSSE